MRHTWRTIGYFTVWGTAYGFIIGFLSGATAWIAGALLGVYYGTVSGAVLGVIIGIMTAFIHAWVFHQDIDIAFYRRRLAAFNGLLVFTVDFGGLVFFMTDVLKRPPPRYDAYAFLSSCGSFYSQDCNSHSIMCRIYVKPLSRLASTGFLQS